MTQGDDNALLLIGMVPAGSPDLTLQDAHMRIEGGEFDALALPVTSDFNHETEEASASIAQVQHRVLCSYVEVTDVFPAAIGSAFSSSAAIADHVATMHADLSYLSDRLANKCEYSLHLVRRAPAEDPSPVAELSGKSYLLRKRDQRNERKMRQRDTIGLIDATTKHFEALSVPFLYRARNEATRLASWDVLLNRSDVERCLQRLSALEPEAKAQGFGLSFVGPYPAFSFLKEDAHV